MAQVSATVGIKNSAFKRGLDDMRNDAKKFGTDIKSTIAGAFAFGAVASFITNFITEMARVKDLSDRLGESSSTIQRVGNAAKLAGSDLEAIIKVLTKLTLSASTSADKFAAVGISAAEFANAGTEGKILLLAQAYDTASGNQAKMLALMDLLGPKGQDVMILLAGGAAAVNEALNQVPVVSDQAINAMARLDDAMDSFKQHAHQSLGAVIGLFQHLGAATVAAYDTLATGGSFSGNYLKRVEPMLDQNGTPKTKTPADLDDKKAAADAAKKTADAAKSLDQELLDLARSRMTAEQNITDLKREQAEHAATAQNKTKTETERLDAAKKVLELQQQIEAGEKSVAKTTQDEADKLAKQQAAAAEKIAKAEGALADEENAQALEKMAPAARIAALKQQQQAMFESAAALGTGGDREAAANAKLEALKMNDEIDASQKELDDKAKEKTRNPSVVSSSLASIGGGGNAYVTTSDPVLQENRRQTSLLQQIASNTRGQGGATTTATASPF